MAALGFIHCSHVALIAVADASPRARPAAFACEADGHVSVDRGTRACQPATDVADK